MSLLHPDIVCISHCTNSLPNEQSSANLAEKHISKITIIVFGTYYELMVNYTDNYMFLFVELLWVELPWVLGVSFAVSVSTKLIWCFSTSTFVTRTRTLSERV